jgi:hypothetical protein
LPPEFSAPDGAIPGRPGDIRQPMSFQSRNLPEKVLMGSARVLSGTASASMELKIIVSVKSLEFIVVVLFLL